MGGINRCVCCLCTCGVYVCGGDLQMWSAMHVPGEVRGHHHLVVYPAPPCLFV